MAYDFNKLIRDSEFLIALVENSAANIKIIKIKNCLKNGADVNVRFTNNANNTPLHIAVIKGDKEVVNILLRHGAKSNVKNDEGKTALELAKEQPKCTDIAELLEAHEEPPAKRNAKNVARAALQVTEEFKYNKRPGTANVRGQLYETKLLTLIYLRAYRYNYVTQFYLATNVDGIGDMDDVCLRFKTVNGDHVIFLQAKHKQDIKKGKITIEDLLNTTGDFSLLKYLDSYIQTRDKFSPASHDVLFRGKFEDLKCYYVIYTTIKSAIECNRKKPVMANEVTDLITTKENIYENSIFQLNYDDQFIKLLTKSILIKRIRNMGTTLFKLIQDNKFDMMLVDKNIQSFHVVLAQKVIKVSEAIVDNCRIGSFHDEFLSSDDEQLTVLRDTLYGEVLKINKLNIDEIDAIISNIYKQPDAVTISELIGSILTYDNNTNTLKLNDKRVTNPSLLTDLQVPQSVANEAYEIAGRRKLSSLTFKLLPAFGNLDVTVSMNKRDKRLEHLANKISDFIKMCADADGNVDIREALCSNELQATGIITHNGGILGAVGNLLIQDDRNKLKFNLNADTLRENAKNLLLRLKDKVNDLHKYRLIKYDQHFPRLSMHVTESEKNIVIDFLNNLYFYTLQAQENELEGIETTKLQNHECFDGFSNAESSTRSNALFLKVHNEIQNWWMTEKSVEYLTKDRYSYIFRDMMSKGLLTFLNIIYVNEIYKTGLEFNSDALKILSVCSENEEANMIVFHADVHVLSCYKLVRHLKGEDCIFLDLDYLCRISPNCLEIIKAELHTTNIKKIVIICEDISRYNDVISACSSKHIILVTSNYIPKQGCISVRDDNINLTDLTYASQHKVLQTLFTYQGVEVTYAEVFDEDTKKIVNSKVLEKIINKEQITVGQTLVQSMYEETKHYYVPRTLLCNESDHEDMFSPLTLIDKCDVFKDKQNHKTYDVVLLLDAHGTGKSTLLTHLSLETKRQYPKIWIQRINLIDHLKQFHEWQKKNIEVNNVEALKFMCKVVLSKKSHKDSVHSTCDNIDLKIDNDEIKVINCEDMSVLLQFELNIFLHSWKKGQIIFLFDGFDEICPQYQTEVTQLLKIFGRCNSTKICGPKRCEQCVWITSRPHNELKDFLEKEFGKSYTLQPFFYEDIRSFVDMYMRRNLNLNTLSNPQLQNINGLFEYMYDNYMDFPNNSNVLKSVYVAAMEYFENELKNFIVTDERLTYIKNWDMFSIQYVARRYNWEDLLSLIKVVPLHVYIAAYNFQNQVKDTTLTETEDLIKQWHLETSTFTFYERFIETKLKTIRFEEQSRMNIYKSDIKLTYDKENKQIPDNNKKLGFNSAGDTAMFMRDELSEVREIIRKEKSLRRRLGL